MIKRLLFIAVIAQLVAASEHRYTFNGHTITCVLGDITQQRVDGIVNAANAHLKGGGGVCGAIFTAADWSKLQAACDAQPATQGVRCPAGQARVTDSCDLRGVKKIIHAVGPDCRISEQNADRKRLLMSAITQTLRLATQNNLNSIAIPFISSAIFAYPKPEACQVIVNTVIEYATHHASPSEIRFVLFSQHDCDLFKKMLDGQLTKTQTTPHKTQPATSSPQEPSVQSFDYKKLAAGLTTLVALAALVNYLSTKNKKQTPKNQRAA